MIKHIETNYNSLQLHQLTNGQYMVVTINKVENTIENDTFKTEDQAIAHYEFMTDQINEAKTYYDQENENELIDQAMSYRN